jgi:hypothetical protein
MQGHEREVSSRRNFRFTQLNAKGKVEKNRPGRGPVFTDRLPSNFRVAPDPFGLPGFSLRPFLKFRAVPSQVWAICYASSDRIASFVRFSPVGWSQIVDGREPTRRDSLLFINLRVGF